MIYDRPYMRDPAPAPRRWRIDQIILFGTIGIFVLQAILLAWFNNAFLLRLFALSPGQLSDGFVWTFLTYGLLHEPRSIIHILFNMLLFFFFARPLVSQMGEKWFGVLYGGCVLLGGLAWLIVNPQSRIPLVGASAGVIGMIICFICLNSRQPLYFFFIPFPIKPQIVAAVLVGFNVFGFLLYELPNQTDTAYSAHLGGALGGWLFYRLLFQRKPLFPSSPPNIEKPSWLKKKKVYSASQPNFQVNLTNRQHLQSEVDRILDKINEKGFGSLTNAEKETLDRARDLLKK